MSTQRRVVLVTGCSKGGIGFALCEQYAAQGCRVYATARRLDSMEFDNPEIKTLALDVVSDENVETAVKTIIEAEGRLDVVVNNAGAMCAGPLLDIPLDEVRRVFETNTFAVLRVAKAVMPHMAARKSGVIVNVGSIAGDIPTAWNGIYSATKAALHAITEVMWQECKPFNVKVVLIAPGSVRSNISNNQLARFNLPESSMYKSFLPQILRRISMSQGANSMPTDEFAARVASATLAPNPPLRLSIGGNAGFFWFLSWLPRTWVLSLIWYRLSKP